VDLIIGLISFLWNIIFTFYYTRARPQCATSPFLGGKCERNIFAGVFRKYVAGFNFFIFLAWGTFPPGKWGFGQSLNDGLQFWSSNLWKLETWMSHGNLDRTEELPDYLFYVVAQDLYTPTYHCHKLWIMMQQRFSNQRIWTVSSWNNLKHQIWKKQCLQFKSPDFASWLPEMSRCIPRNSTPSSSINPATAKIRATNSGLSLYVCFVQGSWNQGISRLTTAAATLASPHVLGVSRSDLKWT